MLGQNLQNVVGQIMDFYLAKTYKKVLPKTAKWMLPENMHTLDWAPADYPILEKIVAYYCK